MNVSVVIPYRAAGDIDRIDALDFVVAYFQRNFPGYELVLGECPTEEWSKGAAVNQGVARAHGEILVLNDADSIVRPEGIKEAVALIEGGKRWIVPHDHVLRLTEAATKIAYEKPMAEWPRDMASRVVRYPYMGPAGGGINVMTREAFDTVNGMDPRFLGWGGEDICFAKALTTMGIHHWRLTGHPLWHLYHAHPAPDLRGSPESEALVARYNAIDMRRDRVAMRELLFSR